jgi:flagellin
MLATIENATNDVTDMLQRIRELAVQAVNDTNGTADREYLQAEVTSLLAEIDRVSTQTVYNNMKLLDGTQSGVVQVGTEAGQSVSYSIDSIGTDAIGADDGAGGITAIDTISVETSADASAALDVISGAIEQVAGQRASYGALQNRLEYTVSNLMNVAEWTNSARSRIEDADFAAESARLAKAQVLQQTGTAMLAQANAASQLALQLIK